MRRVAKSRPCCRRKVVCFTPAGFKQEAHKLSWVVSWKQGLTSSFTNNWIVPQNLEHARTEMPSLIAPWRLFVLNYVMPLNSLSSLWGMCSFESEIPSIKVVVVFVQQQPFLWHEQLQL